MNVWQALLLGIVQGATEFLPISSSGHLVMGQTLLGIQVPGVLFEVAVHVATLLSVAIVYRARLRRLVAGAVQGEAEAWKYLAILAVATVPAALAGTALGDAVERTFEAPAITGIALVTTGAVLWTTRWAIPRAGRPAPDWRDALLVGTAQAVALVPGISRSGATVVAALWLGIRAEQAAEFAFLMAIPVILGAAALELPALAAGEGGLAWPVLLSGTAAAAVTGVGAIRVFVALLRRRAFHRFAIYCWAAGALFLLYLGVVG